MLTKLRQDLNRQSSVSSAVAIQPQGEPDQEEEEEIDNTWEPSDTLTDTLKSLSIFSDLKGMKKKEIRDSYSNFDAWLKSEIYRIVSIEKGKEDESVWGDLE